MGIKKISQLDSLDAITNDTEIPVLVSGVTKRYKPGLPLNIRAFGASPSATAAVNAAAIQAAINAAAAGGGTVVVPPGSYNFNSTITLKSKVSLIFQGGAVWQWTGSTSGTCVETDSADVIEDCVYSGFHVHTGNSFTGQALVFHSCNNIYADVILISIFEAGPTFTSRAFTMIANSTGGEANEMQHPNRNIQSVVIDSLVVRGFFGYGLITDGVAVGYGGSPQVVTLNAINSIYLETAKVVAIDIRNWTDDNSFPGVNRVMFDSDNSIGLKIGHATSQGVYSNHFGLVATDAFGGPFVNRIGIRLEATQFNNILAFYHGSLPEGGQVVDLTTGGGNLIGNFINGSIIRQEGPAETWLGKRINTQDVFIRLAEQRRGSGASFIDLVGDTTYTIYGFRAIRSGGANGTTELLHRGTGIFRINLQEAAALEFDTTGTARWFIQNDGHLRPATDGAVNLGTAGQAVGSVFARRFIRSAGSTLTIAAGVITVVRDIHPVDTEAAAATDDLDTINGGVAGQMIILSAADSARTVVCKDGTGNLKLAGDFALDNAEDRVVLIYDGTNWVELSRSDNGA